MTRVTAGRQVGSILLRKISSGTSGADVYLLRQADETILAAKVTRDARVPASVQRFRRDLLAHHLPEHTPCPRHRKRTEAGRARHGGTQYADA